jgi:hypothetical protein
MHFNWANVALDPYVELRPLDYHKSGLYPLASGLGGTLATFALQAAGPSPWGGRSWAVTPSFGVSP